MTKKEVIIKHIIEMNTNMLSLILDEGMTYMNLTKNDFLKKIDEVFTNCKLKNVSKFTKVHKGKCAGECVNKEGSGYNFSSEGIGNLSLLFEEDDNKIVNICQCYAFETNGKTNNSQSINFLVYDDEKFDFKPSFEQITLMNKINFLYEKFNAFRGVLTPIMDFYPLINECRNTYNGLDFNYRRKFKFVKELFDLYQHNSFVLTIVELNDIATIAIDEFNELDLLNEKSLVKWLLKYDIDYFIFGFKKLDNWDTNHILVPNKFKNVLIDCTNFNSVIQLGEIHGKYTDEMMKRYQPTEEHYKIAGKQNIMNSLPSFLTWHMKYLELLPPDVKIINQWFDKWY